MVKILRLWNDWKFHDVSQKQVQDLTISKTLKKINDPFLCQIWDFVWSLINLPASYWIKWSVLVKSSTFWITIVQRASVKDFAKKIKTPLEYHDYEWIFKKTNTLSWVEISFEAKFLEFCVKKWFPITKEIIEALRKWQIWKLRELIPYDFSHLFSRQNLSDELQNVSNLTEKTLQIENSNQWKNRFQDKKIWWQPSFLNEEWFEKNND